MRELKDVSSDHSNSTHQSSSVTREREGEKGEDKREGNEEKMQARDSFEESRIAKSSNSLEKQGVKFEKSHNFFERGEEELDKELADQFALNFDYLDHFVPPGNDPELNVIPIWEVALMAKKKEVESQSCFEDVSTMFFLGSGESGKSTIKHLFLDSNDVPKQTLFLKFECETSFSSDFKKSVCNIYELGGHAYHRVDLVQTPFLTTHRLDKMVVFLVLDLSTPEMMWDNIETTVVNGRKAVQTALSRMDKNVSLKLIEKMNHRITQIITSGQKPKDDHMDPFPIPIVIIGTKYDVFEGYEPEKRKVITRCLRVVAHYLGASLNFFSMRDQKLRQRVYEIYTHYAYDIQFPKEINMDHSKPLMIPHGGDSLQQIFPGNRPNQLSMDFFKHIFEAKLGKGEPKVLKNPALDEKFREPIIDELRATTLKDLSLKRTVRHEARKSNA